jgi:hypothetical protein
LGDIRSKSVFLPVKCTQEKTCNVWALHVSDAPIDGEQRACRAVRLGIGLSLNNLKFNTRYAVFGLLAVGFGAVLLHFFSANNLVFVTNERS